MIDRREPDRAELGAALLRVTLGGLFLVHAAMKVFVFTPAGTAKFFMSLGLPGPLAYLTIALEIVGGLALIAGIGIRILPLILAAELVGTIVTVHGHAGFFFNNPNGGWEYPAFWAVVLVVQSLIGPGAYALRLPGRVPAEA